MSLLNYKEPDMYDLPDPYADDVYVEVSRDEEHYGYQYNPYTLVVTTGNSGYGPSALVWEPKAKSESSGVLIILILVTIGYVLHSYIKSRGMK